MDENNSESAYEVMLMNAFQPFYDEPLTIEDITEIRDNLRKLYRVFSMP